MFRYPDLPAGLDCSRAPPDQHLHLTQLRNDLLRRKSLTSHIILQFSCPTGSLQNWTSFSKADHADLPETLRDQIAHFFQHYKDLEKGKWATVSEWVGPDEAASIIMEAIRRSEHARDGGK
ncbi:inorganic diphosphatase [Sphingomonas pollutisoli]|uniref:inorganic diphosphatase n=1 Tax=Sphingomonas pollutisoli TaxID=3030829 RepID=UPI003B832576